MLLDVSIKKLPFFKKLLLIQYRYTVDFGSEFEIFPAGVFCFVLLVFFQKATLNKDRSRLLDSRYKKDFK